MTQRGGKGRKRRKQRKGDQQKPGQLLQSSIEGGNRNP